MITLPSWPGDIWAVTTGNSDRNVCPWPCGCHDPRVFGHTEPCSLAHHWRPIPQASDPGWTRSARELWRPA